MPRLSSLLLTFLLSLLLGEEEEDEGFDQFHVDEHLATCLLLHIWTLFLGSDEIDAQDVYCVDGNGGELILMHSSIFLADLELVIILRYVIMVNSSENAELQVSIDRCGIRLQVF